MQDAVLLMPLCGKQNGRFLVVKLNAIDLRSAGLAVKEHWTLIPIPTKPYFVLPAKVLTA